MWKNKKVGLVLSGGGMRGIAHIGVLKALKENNIEPDVISGSSIGGLIGSLYANGLSCREMVEWFQSISIFSIRNYTYKQPGLINTLKFKKHLEKIFEEDSFEHLDKELIINSTNLFTGKLKVFRSGVLFDPILSSLAYPGMFSPIEINGELFADGGATNNFPIEPIQFDCDHIIGSYVNPLNPITHDDIKNSFSILERVMQISMYTKEVNSFHLADIFIIPEELQDYPLFSLKHIDATFEIGYNCAIKKINQFKDNS